MQVPANHSITATQSDYLDMARALAAMVVTFNHTFYLLIRRYEASDGPFWKFIYILTGFAPDAVYVFFVISGFWITSSIMARVRQGVWSWTNYAIDRLSRLWVVLLPVVIAGGLLDVFGRYVLKAPVYLGTQGAVFQSYDIANHLTLGTALGNVLFLQTLVTPTFGSNAPLWSLANEFWYYFWFPALFLLKSALYRNVGIGLVAALTMFMFPTLLIGFMCWLCGGLAFFLSPRIIKTLAHRPSLRSAVPWVALATLVASLLLTRALGASYNVRCLCVALGMALAILAVSSCPVPALPSPLRGLASYGANSSYSLYASHFPILMLLTAVIGPTQTIAPSLYAAMLCALFFCLSIAWGYAFSAVTERHTARVRAGMRKTYLSFHHADRT